MYPYQRHAPSEDGPTRPIRQHFPVMEHPDQSPEQAPLRMREMLYEAADAEAAVRDEYRYRDPLTIFWDETDNDINNDNDNHSSTGAVITRHPPIYLDDEDDDDDEVMRRRPISSVNTSGLNFILAMVLMIMFIAVGITIGELCRSGQCGSSGSGEDPSSSSSQILSTTQAPSVSPAIAPSPEPSAQESYNNVNDQSDNNEDAGNNIFLRPTTLPTPFPFDNDNTQDEWTNGFITNNQSNTAMNDNDNGLISGNDNNDSWYSGTIEPTRNSDVVAINGTDFTLPSNNSTDSSNSTATSLPMEEFGSTNTTASLEDANVTAIILPLFGNDNETTPIPIPTTNHTNATSSSTELVSTSMLLSSSSSYQQKEEQPIPNV